MGRDTSSRVGTTGFHQQIESFRIEVKMSVPVQPRGKGCRTQAMLAIVAVIMPAGIVEQSKEHDHIAPEFRSRVAEVQALFEHPRPMRGAMEPVPVETILPPDFDQEASFKKGRLGGQH